MRYLVTGVAGFIGSNLAVRLVSEGHSVVGIDSLHDYYPSNLKLENLSKFQGKDGFSFYEMDICDLSHSTFDSNFDCIFHLAGQPGVRESWGTGFDSYAHNNVLGTQKVLDYAVNSNIKRIVYSSSSSIYGDAETYPTKESAIAKPRSPYGVSKLTGELLADSYACNFSIEVIALRYFTVYGPGQRPDMAMNRLINCSINGDSFPKFGNGEQVRDFTFVSDVVAANILASSSIINEPFTAINVGGGNSTSLNFLISELESISGRSISIDQQLTSRGDVLRTGADTSRARDILKWVPEVKLRKGLEAQYNWQLSRQKS